MEKLYTVQEVAEFLKITEGTLRNYLSSGKVNFIKVLGNTRIKESELKRLVKPSKEDNK